LSCFPIVLVPADRHRTWFWAGVGTHVLNRLAPLRLVRTQATMLPLPAVEGLLGHAKLPHHLGSGLPLGQPNLCLVELPNDLLRCELLPSWHHRPPSVATTPGFRSECGLV